MSIKGTQKEWSHLYVLIKLLAEGKLHSLNESRDFSILRIFREENRTQHIEYRQSKQDNVELYLNGAFVRKIETAELKKAAEFFYGSIIKQPQGSGSFEIEGAEDFMKVLKCKKIKADSVDKTDITIEIQDSFINFKRICGFSIKSFIGGAPTLFNAGKGTNFKFEVLGVSDDDVNRINAIATRGKVKDRIKCIPELKFISVTNPIFSKNLLFVDTNMEKFMSEMVKVYYRENVSDCAEIANILDDRDPFNLETENIYPHKIKKFLCAVALGLQPAKNWSGMDEANGGYIIVKESGDVIAYHLHDRNSFENYLLNNTKLETPSTSKHDFGKIYVEDGRKFINLNLQIRFKIHEQ